MRGRRPPRHPALSSSEPASPELEPVTRDLAHFAGLTAGEGRPRERTLDASSPALPWSRRGLVRGAAALAGAAAASSLARSALAAPPSATDDDLEPDARALFGPSAGPELQIDLPQLQYGGDWNPRPGAMRELGQELRLRTRLAPMHEPTTVSLNEDELFATPFLYVAGRGGLPSLAASTQAGAGASEDALRRFVDLGGMIVFDDADGGTDRGFRNDLAALVARVLPGSELTPIAAEHVLYRSFYIIDFPAGRTRAEDELLGVQDEGRIKLLYIPNDLGGALARGDDGLHRWPCTPGGNVQREWAMRLGVNILLYATCTDYKSDRAHVETLLHSRRWQ
ncbi:DUF4159 domain-containing protein [Pseudenhygromyxa sp. WMMC2535]|uniref:DUF4159 domain-containing protein n=1 Tax=Pseudenhygromyxa sp. WMMC2535 TaxID=2712867 RepID=UPI001551E472|nr:DUF4159 domain-containing protein [Pseudenhygromyxa sp. WMMC2535]NVB42859.1 DUF4159 domain-containing protein [Pseudenhygromyxa sp. WMMC2535]